MSNKSFERPESVFIRVPEIENICIEYGVDKNDELTVTCMYELYKRVTGDKWKNYSDEMYDEGYNDGYNNAIDDAVSEIDDITW